MLTRCSDDQKLVGLYRSCLIKSAIVLHVKILVVTKYVFRAVVVSYIFTKAKKERIFKIPVGKKRIKVFVRLELLRKKFQFLASVISSLIQALFDSGY